MANLPILKRRNHSNPSKPLRGDDRDEKKSQRRTCPLTLRLMWTPPSAGFLSSSPAPDILAPPAAAFLTKTQAAGGTGAAMWPAFIIGRILITGFDTRLASGSSVARAALWLARARAGPLGVRIGVRPRALRGPCRWCVICTRTGSWVRTRGWRAWLVAVREVINPPTDGRVFCLNRHHLQ
jgi:hypothetical protein